MTAATAILRCTVRGCALPLTRVESRWACEKNHSFDITRHGWVNLLQPQDKRSKQPGDMRLPSRRGGDCTTVA